MYEVEPRTLFFEGPDPKNRFLETETEKEFWERFFKSVNFLTLF